MAMVEKLDLPFPLLSDPRGDLIERLEIRVTAEESARETVRPDKPALTLEDLGPYYLGSHFAAMAMEKKLEGEAKGEVEGYQELVDEYNAAIQETTRQDSS